MSNKFFSLRIFLITLIINIFIIGCNNDITDEDIEITNKLVITGLDEYNGKYVIGIGYLFPYSTHGLITALDFKIDAKSSNFYGGQIKNGSVSLNIWENAKFWDFNQNEVVLFTKAEPTPVFLAILISNTSILNTDVFGPGEESMDDYDKEYKNINTANSWERIGFVALTLTNGGGKAPFIKGLSGFEFF